ncbi:hybrid sensor histidine kinase/response regulator [Alteromonas mediterranea]|uniref:hybrid sensor histidine kinase/response regulator transcription factor n=1 Tax=Alteromonas mediterranea TaxID=314275 RepID=UPI0009044254|nr:ATP-binding protein [Alteromonas mediterranea]APE00644.1 hybrid sensor histidine kinase/response regulator [Alteromonas mediterranea]
MDLRIETTLKYCAKYLGLGAILVIFCLFFSNTSHALEVSLNGKTKFAGISAGIIRDVEVVGDSVYIASENGVFKYLGGQSEKVAYSSSPEMHGTISDLFFDGKETLWIVEFGVGVHKYNLETGASEMFSKNTKWPKYAWKIAALEHFLVVSLIQGVIIVEKSTGVVQDWASNIGVGHVDKVLSIAVHKNEIVYLTSEEGLIVVTPEKTAIELVNLAKTLPLLSKIHSVAVSENNVYIGGKEGVYLWDTFTGEFSFYSFKELSDSVGPVSDIYVSREGRIFIAAGGLYEIVKAEIRKPAFMSPLITSEGIKSIVKLTEISSGELLLASSQLGLISITPSHEAINLIHANDQVLRKNIKTFGVSEEFGYAVKTKDKSYLINLENGELTPSDFWQGNQCIDKNLKIVNKTYSKSIANYAYCDSPFSHSINNSDSSYYAYHDDGEQGFYDLIVNDVIVDKIPAPRQMLFSLSTSSGEIAGFDTKSNFHIQMSKFHWKTISPDEGHWVGLTCLIELEEVFLVCTSGQGVKSISKRNGNIKQSKFHFENEARFIRGGQLTSNKNLWFLTNMGLYAFTPGEQVFLFDESDGFFDTDFEYRGIRELGDRLIILGDKYSYVVDEIKAIEAMKVKQDIKSKVIFTRVEWVDSEMTPRSLSPSSLLENSPIKLENSFNELSLDFRTNSYSAHETQELEFRILGIEDEWKVHPMPQAFLTVSDLNAGHYEFQARVKGEESPVSSLLFEVALPLYLQSYALLCYLLITLCIFILYRVGYLTILWGQFKTTTLYTLLTRYEITDGHSKFEKMLRSKERFINEITHELRTPIQVINGSLEKISDTDMGTRKELVCVQDNMKRVEQLINQMNHDVPTALSIEDYYKSYSLEKIRFIVLSLEPLAKQKRQNLEVRIKGKKEVLLISDSLEKILANLVQNAVKFTPELGTIKVSAVQDSKVLKITVSDDGEGIEDNLQSKVFERFARGNTEIEGNGVGLTMVKTLVELNQGEVTLQSQKGVGTRITVTLPIDDIAFLNSHAENLSPTNAETSKKSLLIVDDSREFRSYLFELFSPKYRCLVARNGTQALDVMQHYLVDVVITDQMMHEMDGLSLTKAIRSNASYANIPILMLTAKTGAELEKSALEEKVDYFLAKPASNEEIMLRVEHLLAVREAKEQGEEGRDQPVFKFGCLKIREFDNEKDMAFYLNFIAVLEKNYHDESFNRDQAATALLISPRSLNRRMSELFDYNFSEFLSRFRVEKSIPLLLEGKSILDTCLDVGFGTAAYFSTSFKKIMHLPPKKFVEQYNKTVA